MPSFNARVKRELCRAAVEKNCCAQAECYGALLLGNTFRADELRVVTSHADFAKRLPRLFFCAFGQQTREPLPPEEGKKWVFKVTEPHAVCAARNALGYGGGDGIALHLNNAVLENDCCASAFLRGAFCSGGTVTDPQKKYLLELATPHYYLSRELSALLHESGFDAASSLRSGVHLLSLKASEAIEDFLTLIGAPLSAMSIMETKVEKSLRNGVNRRVNCDTANLDKTLAAAERLREIILRLYETGTLDALPKTLRDTADARVAYPEDSLAQLAERMGVSKSCLNHRLRKLAELEKGM